MLSFIWPRRLWQWLARPRQALLLLVLLAAFPLYYELGRHPVYLWDESRMAVNGAEMARNHHWLVPYFAGLPDHWNTKPPLLTWLQALGYEFFGFSTWALRVPTLLATLATVLLLFRFAAHRLQDPLAGLLAVAVLVTCGGYVRVHVARTGDYDALLTCWQVLLWTQFFQYLETGTRRHLVWAAGALLAAIFTKGPAGLLGLPGLAAYAMWRGKLGWLLRQAIFYRAAAGGLGLLGGYLLLREAADPGYWQAVQRNDLGGRYLTAISNNGGSWHYYLSNLKNGSLGRWGWFLPPALVLAWRQPSPLVRRAAALLVAFVGSWLLVISLAQTKLPWYDAPIYPALALLVGLGLRVGYVALQGLATRHLGRATGRALCAGLFAALLCSSYYTIIQHIMEERPRRTGLNPDEYLGPYLLRLAHAQPRLGQVALLARDERFQLLAYYKLWFEHWPGHRLAVVPGRAARRLPAGAVVVVCRPAYRAALDSAFTVVVLHQEAPCQTLLLRPRP